MKAVVTGAAGFVGSHVCQELVDRGVEVVGLDQSGVSMPADTQLSSGFRLIGGDVRDPKLASNVIDSDTDVVFHLAAVVGVTNYLNNPFDVVEINLLGTKNILEAAGRVGSRFLLASTSEIYGKNPKVPWSEDDDRVLGPTQVDRWSYSTSKAAAEHLVLAASERFSIPTTIVRYFNAYGPRQKPNYVISKSIHRAMNGRRPLVYDRGGQTRCFTYIDDIVRGTVDAATTEAGIGEVFNLGNSVETTIREAVETVLEVLDSSVAPQDFATDDEFGSTYQDIDRRVPDVTKAAQTLGWKASIPLRDGVARTIQWARSHPSWLEDVDTSDSEATTSSITS